MWDSPNANKPFRDDNLHVSLPEMGGFSGWFIIGQRKTALVVRLIPYCLD
jgi:hypothetical protein